MTNAVLRLMITLVAGAALAFTDLDALRAEPSLEKRSEKALEHAKQRLDAARELYQKGETEPCSDALQELRESVVISHDSLKETKKNPRKNFKYYKRAEIATRQLLRRLESFRNEMSYQDREMLDPVIGEVQQTHQELLHAIMGGGKSGQ
jgi:hypothetical protein